MKSKLVLRTLRPDDESLFLAGLRDWDGEDLTWYSFDWKPGMTFKELLAKLENESKGIGLPEGWVPATMFYGFVDGEIVGRVNVRHRLNDLLLHRGGHIGYAISPRHRRKGYANEMVMQVLPHCRAVGISRVLVTCSDDNTPSWRVIERNGGVLENKVWDDVDKETIRRYWIELRERRL